MRLLLAMAMLSALTLCACSDDDPCANGSCQDADIGVDLAVDAGPPDADAAIDQFTGDIVFFDDSQVIGWPAEMAPGVSGGYLLAPMEGVALADLDGKGALELIASSGDKVYVFDSDGKPHTGWPAQIAGTGQAPPSVGDVDGDGKPEVVQAGRGLLYSDTSYVHVFDHEGKDQPGWPKAFDNLVMEAPSLADLDGDGAMEIIVQIGKWPPAGTIEVLRGDGSAFGTDWKHDLDSYPLAPAAVGDIDGDGKLEVGYLTLGNLTVRSSDGALRTGFPIAAAAGYVNEGSLVFADLDPATPSLELIWADIEDRQGHVRSRLWAADADGKTLAGFPVSLLGKAIGIAPLIVADVDGDSALEAVVPVKPDAIYVVSLAGSMVVQPIKTSAMIHASVRAVDLTGDGKLELLVDNNTTDTNGIGYLEGYKLDGTQVNDFPLRPFGSTMGDSGTVGDLDGDGTLELALVTTSMLLNPPVSWVSLWRIGSSKAAPLDWPAYAFDARRSNCPRCASASTP